MKKIPSYTPVAIAVAALLQTGVAYSQEGTLKLDEVVVTSSSTAKSKMRSSVSVTDVDQDQIKDFGARSESEILTMIPGIRTDPAAGPGGVGAQPGRAGQVERIGHCAAPIADGGMAAHWASDGR